MDSLFIQFVACSIVGNLLAGNLLGGVHAAGHKLGAKKAPMSRLLEYYWKQHLAHHIIEMQHNVAPETRMVFMTTPWQGWLFIGFATGMCSVAFAFMQLFYSVQNAEVALFGCWAGMTSFFMIYEEVHARTHAGHTRLISWRHAKHHTQPKKFFGIFWCYDWIAHPALLPIFLAELDLLRQLEDQLMRFSWFSSVMEHMLLQADDRLMRAKCISGVHRAAQAKDSGHTADGDLIH